MKQSQAIVSGYSRTRNGKEIQVKPYLRARARVDGFLIISEACQILHKRSLNLQVMIREKQIRATKQGKITRIAFSEVIKANRKWNGISKEETLQKISELIEKKAQT